MPRSHCGICGELDDNKNLHAACPCYKKTDENGVHKKCLENLLSQMVDTDDLPRCPHCGSTYSLKVRDWKFEMTLSSFFSCASIASMFEIAMMLFVFLLLLALPVFFYYTWDTLPMKPIRDKKFTFVFSYFAIIAMYAFALKKVVGRWKKTQSTPDVEVSEV
uniref:RING-CH-type domain-containing protein n=1 Tax=Palpitomonas bilix TaxID=652834 RepID=A0A7S3FZJ9_9EUKA|mmetsp:Transcript_12899/g.34009  ORF Transcript_12899/g.34009 Transcript_12899/m.34009 type:complete len:162 (+) Transcript_12899:256-741(+)